MAKKTYHIKTVTVEVDTTKLEKLAAELQARAHALLDKTALDIEASAKMAAPVDTGALRSSIYVSGTSKQGSTYTQARSEARSKVGTVGRSGRRLGHLHFNDEVRSIGPFERVIAPSVVYAIFPEIRGQAYLQPAVEMHRARFLAAWGDLLK